MTRRPLFSFLEETFYRLVCVSALLANLTFLSFAHAANDFVVLGEEGIWVREGSTVVSGDVGANVASDGPWLASDQEVTVGENVIVQDPTSAVKGDTMRLKSGSQLQDVSVNTLRGPGLIQGTLTTPVTLPLVSAMPPIPPVTPGSVDHNIPNDGTLSLDAGNYGLLKVGKRAVVTLTGGEYHFREWDLRADAKVYAAAAVVIRVAEHLETRSGAEVGPEPTATNLTAADVQITGLGINGTTGAIDATPEAVRIGMDSTIRANIYAPNGLLRIRDNGIATGAFVGKWVRMGNGGTITLEGGFGLGAGGDTTPPVVTVPADIAVAAVDANGTPASDSAIQAFLNGASALDDVDGPISPTNDAPSVFPRGGTDITFSATDVAGNTGTAIATVTVADLTQPVVTAPSGITVPSVGGSDVPATDPVIVAFLNGATAVDNVDGALIPTNNAPSVFAVGATVVTFSATDAAGNTGTATSTVIVDNIPPPDTIPPSLSILTPGTGTFVFQNRPTIHLSYDDENSGVNTGSLTLS